MGSKSVNFIHLLKLETQQHINEHRQADTNALALRNAGFGWAMDVPVNTMPSAWQHSRHFPNMKYIGHFLQEHGRFLGAQRP